MLCSFRNTLPELLRARTHFTFHTRAEHSHVHDPVLMAALDLQRQPLTGLCINLHQEAAQGAEWQKTVHTDDTVGLLCSCVQCTQRTGTQNKPRKINHTHKWKGAAAEMQAWQIKRFLFQRLQHRPRVTPRASHLHSAADLSFKARAVNRETEYQWLIMLSWIPFKKLVMVIFHISGTRMSWKSSGLREPNSSLCNESVRFDDGC